MVRRTKKPSGDAMFRFASSKKIEVKGKAGVHIIVGIDLSQQENTE